VSNFRVRALLAFAALIGVIYLPGCGGSHITITLTPAGQSACGTNTTSSCAVTLNQGDSIAISASVANDSTNSGVTWSLGSSEGTLSSQTTTSVTYVAPDAITANSTATITATSIANTSVTANVTVTIEAVFGFQSASLPVATVGQPYNGVISTEGATGPFSWTITSGNLPAGLTLSNSDSASANVTGTPTATGTSTVTIQVTDGAGQFISKTFTITVNPPPSLAVATRSLPDGTVGSPYPSASSPNFTLQASSGTPPYSWSIVPNTGTLPAGLTLSDGGLISGTPTSVGTSNFTVQVTDSATPNPATATANLSITINPSLAFNSQLSGNYAFLVNGYDANGGRFVAAGSFLANGAAGTISNGVMDINDSGTVQLNVAFSGTYLLGSNGLGTISFSGTGRTFALSFVASGTPATIQSANMIEFDNTGDQASGQLLMQTTSDFATSAIAGNYAFGFLGTDSTHTSRYALGGQFVANGSGTLTSGALDSDSAASGITSDVALTGTYSVASTGRGTMSLSTTSGATNYSFYVVTSTEFFAVEIDDIVGTSSPIVGGTVLQQTGTLTSATLNGTAVFETTALQSGPSALSQLGIFTTNGSSTLTTSFDQNTGGATKTGSGTYSVTSTTGRTTLTGSGLAASDPVVYLVNTNQGFIIGTDSAVTFGYFTQQTPPFTAASLNGTYAGGTIPPVLSGPSGEIDIVVADGVSALSFTTDASGSGGLIQNQTSSNTFSLLSTSNGRGTIPSSGTPTAIFYMISPSQFWEMPISSTGMIEQFEQ
jgi:large repetitive protein